jgi:maltoporin
VAFQNYLEALISFEQWDMVVGKTEVALVAVDDDGIDRTKSNATEASIADQLDRRKVAEEMRDASSVVIRAAHDAWKTLLEWLAVDRR